MGVGTQDHIAAIATITAVGAALRDEFLAAEAGGTVSPVARLGMNPDSIDEHPATMPEASGKVPLFSGQWHPS